MKRVAVSAILLSSLFFFTRFSFGQPVLTATPFLLINPSTEANGMGGIMTSTLPTNASAMIFNPAQAGMLSQTQYFSSDFYQHRVSWLPSFGLPDLWINNNATMVGFNTAGFLPLKISVGVGYSQFKLNLGDFVRTDDRGNEIGRFRGYETSDALTVGIGIDYGIIVAMGVTTKHIKSVLSPIGTAAISAQDYGFFICTPLHRFIFSDNDAAGKIFTPFANINLAYAVNNIGDYVVYVDPAQADPLPRNVRAGWSVDIGTQVKSGIIDLNLISFTVAREAEDVLSTRRSDNSIGPYQTGLGDIDIQKNLIESRSTSSLWVRRGLSVSMLETFTYRQGSVAENPSYKTQGYSVSTRGLFKTWSSTMNEEKGFNPFKIILRHIEFRFSQCSYSGDNPLINTLFDGVVFAVHQ